MQLVGHRTHRKPEPVEGPHALIIHRQVCDAGHKTRLGVTWLPIVLLGQERYF